MWRWVEFWPFPLTCFVAFTTLVTTVHVCDWLTARLSVFFSAYGGADVRVLVLLHIGLDWPVKNDKRLWHNSSVTSFFILFADTQNHQRKPFLMVFGPLNVVAHLPDPQKAHPCVKSRVLSHVPSKSIHGHFSRRVQEKDINKKVGVIFHVFADTFPYDRLAQIWGYVFVSWT